MEDVRDDERRTLVIDRSMFEMAMATDRDYQLGDAEAIPYLDRETGEIDWVYEDDEDAESIINIPAEENRVIREAIEAAPDRYLEIPGVDHGDHHDILRRFLRSPWTDDDEAWQRAHDAYRGSIGRWKDAVDDRDVIHAYYRFQEQQVLEIGVEFLRDNGIEPEWK